MANERNNMAWAVLMLQKEVAERLTAETGTKSYGILTVRLAACAVVTKLLDLGPQHFHPRPRVEAAFQQRRKTLVNALAASKPVNLDKKVIAAGLAELGLDARIRGERLSVEDFVALTNVLRQKSRS